MLTSSVLLLIISSIALVAEIYTTRTTLTHELRVLASTLSANSRQPLVLGQYSEIDALFSSLIHQDNIRAAYFFDSNGVPVAEYLQQYDSRFVLQALQSDFDATHQSFWTDSTAENFLSDLGHFSLFAPVFYDGKRVGTLYLLSDKNRLYGHMSGVVFGIILSLMLLIFLSWLLAGRLHKPVSGPLLHLAGLMENISAGKDYSLRAERVSRDEIGTLVEGFNHMLEQIEFHQASLAEHQLYLEQTVSDRTAELRTAVTALEQARQQADTANQAKSHFLSRMTHELRTPLIGVLGMNELLTRTSLTAQQQELVDMVQKSGEQLLDSISNILDFARIEAGKLQLEYSEFSLVQVIQDVVALLSLQAQEKGLSLRVDIPRDAMWKVRGDETRIRQILVNLIGNAIKFTPSGSINIGLSCLKQGDSSGTFELEVADSGIGMSAEVKQQVFDVFYQVDGTGTGAKSGTGLGLAIVRQLVELMDGKLNLVSAPGQGSRFQVTLDLPLVEKTALQKGGC